MRRTRSIGRRPDDCSVDPLFWHPALAGGAEEGWTKVAETAVVSGKPRMR
jgi:hypothetical protein